MRKGMNAEEGTVFISTFSQPFSFTLTEIQSNFVKVFPVNHLE